MLIGDEPVAPEAAPAAAAPGPPPRVAAVTINFGPPDDTLECVRSLLANGYGALSVYLTENGSPPGHRERLQRELPAGPTLILAERNLGFSGGNNLAIARALADGADYVLLINNDATLEPGAIQRLVDTAGQVPRLGVLTCKIMRADTDGPTDEIWYAGGGWSRLKAQSYHRGMGERDRGQYDTPGDTEFAVGCLWLVPRAVFGAVGLLPDEYFIYGEDTEYCVTLLRRGYRIWYEPAARCYHKVSRTFWKDRKRASPVVNYYSNRNRILLARKLVPLVRRPVFYAYLFGTRIVLALLRRDRSYLYGLWDGLRGRIGQMPPLPAAASRS